MAKLYLIPNLLSNNDWQNVLPASVYNIINTTSFYIVENVRTARRFLKKINSEIDIDKLEFFILNKHTPDSEVSEFLKPLETGNNVAVISEAGCPGVADPGAEVVRLAHEKGLKIIPMTGPSSVILSLMASGLNGQNFAFNGYLPVSRKERIKSIAVLEKKALNSGQTQIFIETPYRNNQLIKDILTTCSSSTLLCIAVNLTATNESVNTRTIQQWKKQIPDIHKQPAIFLVGV